jgi:hypothetical protein
MIRIGKITAAPDGVKLANAKVGLWLYHSYSTQEAEDTVSACNQLSVATEFRLPPSEISSYASAVLSHQLLDAISMPNTSLPDHSSPLFDY